MKLPDLQKHILKILIPLWLILSSTLWIVLRKLLPVHKLNDIEGLIWAKITSILFVTLMFSACYVFVLHRRLNSKPNVDDYVWVDDPGYYTHPGEPFKICPKCLHKEPPSVSPLTKTADYWLCSVCDSPVGIKGDAFNIED